MSGPELLVEEVEEALERALEQLSEDEQKEALEGLRDSIQRRLEGMEG